MTNSIVYVKPGTNGNMQIPIRVQVKYAADYCKNSGLEFTLPVTESLLKGDRYMFPSIVERYENIIIFSIGLLGTKEMEILYKAEEQYLQKTAFHFTFERERFSGFELIDQLRSIDRYNRINGFQFSWSST